MPNPPNTFRRSNLLPGTGALLVSLGLLALGTGCQRDQVAHYRVPREATSGHPDHPGHAEEAMPSEGMSAGMGQDASNVPPPPTPKGALKWSLPKGWREEAGGGMRFATFKAPFEGKLEATVVVLPGPAGGELANVNRWRGQIGLPPMDEAGLAKGRTVLKTKAGALNVYDFMSEGQAKSRMVAGYISTPDGNTWFLKMTGDAAPVAKAKSDFMTILGSVRLD
ncbi:hypothetical protein GETHLI_04870 [Geothrix limicola]|uniref:Lipoprotein n=1 Tax=Geothrix limicola TaxID=2927978 RepID=A0ABQ5QC02_9BACT|nr:hypothetical protein [Geothrix limicola]GLH71985.1 hypothetical protein GETHLI_04870 [Geothrix limicola]